MILQYIWIKQDVTDWLYFANSALLYVISLYVEYGNLFSQSHDMKKYSAHIPDRFSECVLHNLGNICWPDGGPQSYVQINANFNLFLAVVGPSGVRALPLGVAAKQSVHFICDYFSFSFFIFLCHILFSQKGLS